MKISVVLILLAARLHAFEFAVPPGWTNLSTNAPPSELAKAPPLVVEQVKQGHFAFFAADLDGMNDGFMENVNVLVDKGSTKISTSFLHDVVANIGAEVAKSGTQYRVVESGLTKVNGITVGRYVGELQMGPTTVKQIGYILPGKSEHAIVTYSTTPEKFAQYQPIFDAAAQATLGVAEPSFFEDSSSPFRWQSIVATLAALAGLIVYSLIAKRRRA